MAMRKNRSKRGVTLIEIVTVVMISAVTLLLLGTVTTTSAMTFNKVSAVGTAREKGTMAFEKIQADVRRSAATLRKYPALGTATETAENNRVLILKLPKFDSSDVRIDGEFDVMVYKVVDATVPAEGPKMIEKWVATISGTTETPLVLEGVVAKNLASVKWATGVNAIFYGNDWQQTFWLPGYPDHTPDKFPIQVFAGGHDLYALGRATNSGSSIVLDRPLKYYVALDVLYETDPASLGEPNGGNGGTCVSLEFVVDGDFQHNDFSSKKHDITLTAIPRLENKE
jgi:competence protein ComGC